MSCWRGFSLDRDDITSTMLETKSVHMCFKYCFSIVLFAVCVSIGTGDCNTLRGAERERVLKGTAEAPANSRHLRKTLGGAYFVDTELLKQQESLKERLTRVRADIENKKTTSEEAMKSLAAIELEYATLKAEIERKKVLVSAFNVYTKVTEETFPLGEERLVIVTGDNVKIRGWEGPGIKCVVEKIIVAKEQPQDSEFDAIQIQHQLIVPVEFVGMTDQEQEAQEKKFQESDEGRKLTDEQKLARQRLVDEIRHRFDDLRAFQGRKANTIAIAGLQDGNSNLVVKIDSPGGGSSLSSQWQRHANVTVYVPACESLAVRGCQVGLDIADVTGDLVLTTDGSKDRNYEGQFVIRGVKGNVVIDQAPVRSLVDVTGDVRFTATNEFVNSGTNHLGGLRTRSSYGTSTTRIDRVQGNFTAEFLRTDLKLAAIGGLIDVVNEFGTTELTMGGANAKKAQRIVSESGTINVVGRAEPLKQSLLHMYTQCGTLRTNLADDILEDTNFSTGRPQMAWQGFVATDGDPFRRKRFSVDQFDRPAEALEDRERAPGFDLISRAGTVSVMAVSEVKGKKEAEQK